MKSIRVLILSIAIIAASCILYLQFTQKSPSIVNTTDPVSKNKLILNDSSD